MRKFIEQLGGLLASGALVFACVGPPAVEGDSAEVGTHGALRVEVVSLPSGAPLSDVIVRLEARHDTSALPIRQQQIDRERVRAHALPTAMDKCNSPSIRGSTSGYGS